MKQIRAIIWGITIITLGVIFGGNALGLFDLNVFFDGWWTLFIIIPSAISLATEKQKLSSFGMLIAGALLLLAAQDVITYAAAGKAILATFLVLIGLTIIFKTIVPGKNDKEVEKKVKEMGDNDNMDSQTAIFSGSDKKYNGEVFGGANLTAVFGGVELDLRKAKFTKDTVIKAYCMFGGIDIKVPENIRVKINSGFLFGGAIDERKGDTSKGKYTIYIDVNGGFGGVSINDREK